MPKSMGGRLISPYLSTCPAGVQTGAERKRQDAVQTILFPIGSFSAMAPSPSSLRSATSPKGRGKGVDMTLIQPIFFRFLKTRKYFLFFALIYAKIIRIM